jgi:hypothetical protein
MTIEQLQEQLDAAKAKLSAIHKIAEDARNGVHPADWRKDWQRNEWTKVRDLANV